MNKSFFGIRSSAYPEEITRQRVAEIRKPHSPACVLSASACPSDGITVSYSSRPVLISPCPTPGGGIAVSVVVGVVKHAVFKLIRRYKVKSSISYQ